MKEAPIDLGATLPLEATAGRSRALDFLSLAKPRLNLLVIATSAVGFYLGAGDTWNIPVFVHAVLGTALVAGGAAALNQLYERDTDRLMRRTRTRPLPDGRLAPTEAAWFGGLLSAAGLLELTLGTNLVAAALALATLLSYVVVYTPLKRRSSAATLVGAVPGALPPLIGWAAARGHLTIDAWVLFAIVFLWQLPHFLAIAWMYRDDFALGGFPLLPVLEPDGRSTGRQALAYALVLVPVSLSASFIGLAGRTYFLAALLLGVALVGFAVRFARLRTLASARALFFATITYLPLLWGFLLADRVR